MPSASLGPPGPPQTSPRAGGPTLVPSSVGGSVPNSSISSSGTGTRALGEDFGGCEVGWAGIALQEEDQLGRKSLGKNLKEKRSFLEYPSSPQHPRSPFHGMWLLQDPGSAPKPTLHPWEGAGEFGWISPPAISPPVPGEVFTPWNGFWPFPTGSPGSARARSWDGLSHLQPSCELYRQ